MVKSRLINRIFKAWACSSVGRASDLHSEGHGFESHLVHERDSYSNSFKTFFWVRIVQMNLDTFIDRCPIGKGPDC